SHPYPIHLKLNTGMNRLGFTEKDFDELTTVLSQTDLVKVETIFSHLATSDIPQEKSFTLQQIQTFQKWTTDINEPVKINPVLHILNTSGIYNFNEYQMDMVRIGIGLYGVGNDLIEDAQLQNVATLKSVILQVNEIEKDETVGYGRRFKATKKSRIATITIGYADGIRRSNGNGRGYVLINGQNALSVGTICIDMLMA